MEGFFTKQQVSSISRPNGVLHTCASCGLSSKCTTPKMKPFGNFKKGILNIGIHPSLKDDKIGRPWQDSSGSLLREIYACFGIDLEEDCLNVYALMCHPSNDEFTNIQLQSCRKSLLKIINEEQPKVIITLGWEPLQSLLSQRWKKDMGSIDQWRGWTIPDQELKAWVCPTYSPDYIHKNVKKPELSIIWKADIEKALKMTQIPWIRNKNPIIEYISDLSPLNSITSEVIAFDYETTGLKPHAKGHRIICASVADTEDHVYSFLMPENKNGRKPFINLLKNELIGKMAHNMKFEEAWSVSRLKQPVQNWEWDSMIAAHILDNRESITSLKFQTYVNFGVVDYASEITPYLQATEKGANNINRIHSLLETKVNVEKLLKYCALDSIYQYRLAMKQTDLLGYHFLPF